MYKAGKPRFSKYFGYQVVDIYKKIKLFGFIPFWQVHDIIKDCGQADEVVMLLNNPSELKNRIAEGMKKLKIKEA